MRRFLRWAIQEEPGFVSKAIAQLLQDVHCITFDKQTRGQQSHNSESIQPNYQAHWKPARENSCESGRSTEWNLNLLVGVRCPRWAPFFLQVYHPWCLGIYVNYWIGERKAAENVRIKWRNESRINTIVGMSFGKSRKIAWWLSLDFLLPKQQLTAFTLFTECWQVSQRL